MPSKNKQPDVTQNTLRTTFAILRQQLRLADSSLRLRAIHEFDRELTSLYNEEVDRLAQANGRTYRQQMEIIAKEAQSWTAEPPSA